MTTDALRAAAQALLDAHDHDWTSMSVTDIQQTFRERIAAVRAALASTPAQAEPTGEWVMVPRVPTPMMVAAYLGANDYYWQEVDKLPRKNPSKWRNGTVNEATSESLIAAIAAAPPAPQPTESAEPVAQVVLMTTGGNAGLSTRIVEIDDHLRERLHPGDKLYAHPPRKARMLTDEELHDTVVRGGHVMCNVAWARSAIRAFCRVNGIEIKE